MTEASRAEFEKHVRDNCVIALEYGHLSLERDTDDSYVHGETNEWWMIWQASRRAIVLPEPPHGDSYVTLQQVKQAIGVE